MSEWVNSLDIRPIPESLPSHKFRFRCEDCDVKWSHWKAESVCWSCDKKYPMVEAI